ncbi:MAG: DNA primase [Candidatus Delongbacteria bacterium]|nr:DNA primase [Candidatus Delongbacteria bacterium]
MISKEQIESVVNAADIVDVIGERVDLRRSGANHKAACPFHDEKTASFMVSHAKQIFKCFGCGVAGDSIKFIMLYENLNYPDAIRLLAARYGIEIKESFSYQNHNKTDDDKKETMRSAMKLATEFYHQNLLNEIKNENSKFTQYIKERGLTEEDCKIFKIGYAPDKWHALKENIKFKDIDDKLLIEVGLRKQNEKGNIYDLFRNRLMFPVFDILGNVIAFSARTLDDEIQPKYVNSPESTIYKKSKVFFGFYQSKDTVRKTHSMILVEGNMDMVSMFKNGFTNTVALCGTAFTEDHAQTMKRNADNINILFDGDVAGKKAAFRTAELLISNGMDPKIIILPDELDPDTFLKIRSRSELDNLLAKGIGFIGMFFLTYDKSNMNASNRIKIIDKIFESLGRLSNLSESKVAAFLKEASDRLGIGEESLKKDFETFRKSKKSNYRSKAPQIEPTEKYVCDKKDLFEFNILYLMLSDKKVCSEYLRTIDESYFLNHEATQLYMKFYELYEEGESINLNNILVDFDDKFKDFFIDYTASQEGVFLADIDEGDEVGLEIKIDQAFKDSFKKIKLRFFKREIKKLYDELKFTSDDVENEERIMKEIAEIKSQEIEIGNS